MGEKRKRHRFLLWLVVVCSACGHSSDVLENNLDFRNAPPPAASASFTAPPSPTPTPQPETTGRMATGDPYIQEIIRFSPGEGAGYGAASGEEWLKGPPYGGGRYKESADVVSLGNGGEIILEFPDFFPVDGEGPDFIVFENAFFPFGSDQIFAEPAVVGISQDGEHFVEFLCERQPPFAGCAGTHPVFANPFRNTINPQDPQVAGGDPFDLREAGLSHATFIRLKDIGLNAGGNSAIRAGQAGFDLDAISIVHGAVP